MWETVINSEYASKNIGTQQIGALERSIVWRTTKQNGPRLILASTRCKLCPLYLGHLWLVSIPPLVSFFLPLVSFFCMFFLTYLCYFLAAVRPSDQPYFRPAFRSFLFNPTCPRKSKTSPFSPIAPISKFLKNSLKVNNRFFSIRRVLAVLRSRRFLSNFSNWISQISEKQPKSQQLKTIKPRIRPWISHVDFHRVLIEEPRPSNWPAGAESILKKCKSVKNEDRSA